MKRMIAVALMGGSVLTGAVAANAFTGVGTAGPEAQSTIVKAKGDGPRHGHRGPRGPRRMIMDVVRQADANQDGALTQDEIDVFIQTKVDGADANGDGNVSLEEFKVIWLEIMDRHVVDRFQSMDQDGDGQITPEERAERFGMIVSRFDRNGDGELSREDMRRGKRHGRHHGRHGGPRHERGEDRGAWNAPSPDDAPAAAEPDAD